MNLVQVVDSWLRLKEAEAERSRLISILERYTTAIFNDLIFSGTYFNKNISDSKWLVNQAFLIHVISGAAYVSHFVPGESSTKNCTIVSVDNTALVFLEHMVKLNKELDKWADEAKSQYTNYTEVENELLTNGSGTHLTTLKEKVYILEVDYSSWSIRILQKEGDYLTEV